jgi:hypothetical protein
MQLLSVGIARSVWLFDVNELNPTGKNLFPEMMMWLGERYQFQIFPKSSADVDKESKGLIFKTGQFQSDEGAIGVNFSFFSDGLIAETWASTEKSDAFLEDLLRSAATKYGLAYTPEIIRTKQYISELNVRLDHHLNNVNPKIVHFCETISRFFERQRLPPFEMSGMIFSPDTSGSAYKPPGLLIERKLGTPFTENRFWSKSPFTTADHMLALQAFDELLADGLGR